MKPVWNIQGECAGKTGTTNSEADAWFIGYTPQLLGGVWVGCEDRFVGTGLGEGSRAAMPIWGEFFKRLQANTRSPYNKVTTFEKPISMGDMDECDNEDQIRLFLLIRTNSFFSNAFFKLIICLLEQNCLNLCLNS